MSKEVCSRDPVVDIVNYDEYKNQSSKRTGKATDEILVGGNHTYEW